MLSKAADRAKRFYLGTNLYPSLVGECTQQWTMHTIPRTETKLVDFKVTRERTLLRNIWGHCVVYQKHRLTRSFITEDNSSGTDFADVVTILGFIQNTGIPFEKEFTLQSARFSKKMLAPGIFALFSPVTSNQYTIMTKPRQKTLEGLLC